MSTMDLLQLAKVCRSEEDAFQFLFKRRRDRYGISCPGCSSSDYYFMHQGRLRCKDCKRDYHPFSGTLLNELRISYSTWLWLVKLFELEVSARKAKYQLDISYPTTLKGFDTIRRGILYNLSLSDDLLKGEIEADESYFGGRRKGKRGRGAGHKTIVFGILERGGKVSVSIVPNASAEALLTETVKKVRRGSIVYTDKWVGYDSLMFCGYKHLNIDHRYKFKQGKVYINGVEGFWSFAKERLIKHHGISKEKFPIYIKEMEWRYNNKGKDLFDLLVCYLLGAVSL